MLPEKILYRAGLVPSQLDVGNNRYLSTTGSELEQQHQLSELHSVSLGLQAARLDCGNGNEPRNANFTGLNGG